MQVAGSRRPGPDVEPPADIDPRDLDHEIRSQLRTLSKVAADRVARHLVAAGQLVDEDPEAALVQARAARALGARVAVVRQAVGETAYAAGEWAEAIAELRTARRMTGDDSALPLLADAERALGRPDRALRLAQSPEAQALPPAERAEMRIVEAGARRDLGQLDAALVTLQGPGLDRRTVEPWSARLWYAFADLLLALGRTDEAREWFAAAAAADQDGGTDADERILELDGVLVLTDDEDDEEESPTDAAAGLAPATRGDGEAAPVAGDGRPGEDLDEQAAEGSAADGEVGLQGGASGVGGPERGNGEVAADSGETARIAAVGDGQPGGDLGARSGETPAAEGEVGQGGAPSDGGPYGGDSQLATGATGIAPAVGGGQAGEDLGEQAGGAPAGAGEVRAGQAGSQEDTEPVAGGSAGEAAGSVERAADGPSDAEPPTGVDAVQFSNGQPGDEPVPGQAPAVGLAFSDGEDQDQSGSSA